MKAGALFFVGDFLAELRDFAFRRETEYFAHKRYVAEIRWVYQDPVTGKLLVQSDAYLPSALRFPGAEQCRCFTNTLRMLHIGVATICRGPGGAMPPVVVLLKEKYR